MSTESHNPNRLSHDELDALLRVWHDVNAERAAAGRDELMQQLRAGRAAAGISPSLEGGGGGVGESHSPRTRQTIVARLAGSTRSGSLRAAASFFLLITLIALLIPVTSNRAVAKPDVIMVPDGGRLEALDDRGNVIGPCALKHTDVVADIAGPFSRVILTQQYHNPYDRKIEAVYTFPLSHRSSVDRMVMTVKTPGEPDRIVEGEVKERQQARQMYQAARQAGYVASLLEQERPNIFTQSVANIEPNAQVFIEISYIEMLQQRDGEYSFDFPMVVAPRYIPGSPTASLALLPAELKQRRGVILRGPAQLIIGQAGDISGLGSLQAGKLESLLFAAQPIEYPGASGGAGGGAWWGEGANAKLPAVWYPFEATYCDGARELGMLFVDGTGQINNRWFSFDPDPRRWQEMGAGYEPDTNQVPDASRITPMPVRPPTRAGHDVSLTVNIDTGEGGPGIVDVQSDLHAIAGWNGGVARPGDAPRKATIALKNQREIPNRDFVLRWRCESDAIQEAVFTHADPKWIERVEVPALTDIVDQGAAPRTMVLSSGGGFFTIVIAPPARVDDAEVLPRELIFVLDTSGSMSGQPIEKAKAVMSRAIETMRPGDTFNMITFSGDTRILWNAPRPNTQANRDEAQHFLAGQSGGGGTEMMSAINAALAPTPRHAIVDAEPAALTPVQLANLPADGREVVVAVDAKAVEAHHDPDATIDSTLIPVNERVSIRARWLNQLRPWLIAHEDARGAVHLRGKWSTINGERVLEVAEIVAAPIQRDPDIEPMRVVMFLTDGQVGNDDAIIAAVREHAKTTRVFSFGIGDSPNRYLLDGIAQAGRGESEYVNLNNNPDESVKRFVTRIASPVLRDIEIVLSEGLQIGDSVPALDAIPDLWDLKPLIIHGRYPIGDAGAGAKPPSGQAQSGTITIKGKTAHGDYERTIDITLPQRANDNPMLPALWARGKIDQVIASDIDIKRNGGMVQNASPDTRNAIIALGERYHIASSFTSFVAVEKSRMTIGGQSVLVPVPIELPSGMEWEGVFGWEAERERAAREMVQRLGANGSVQAVRKMQEEGRLEDALAATNAILEVDAHNPSAEALRDIITTTAVYRAYMDTAGVREVGFDALTTEQQASMRIPRRNITGPGPHSVSGLMEYPVDWNVGLYFMDAPDLDLSAALGQAQQNSAASGQWVSPNMLGLAQDGIRARDGFASIRGVTPADLALVDRLAQQDPSFAGIAAAAPSVRSGEFSGAAGGGGTGGGDAREFFGQVELPRDNVLRRELRGLQPGGGGFGGGGGSGGGGTGTGGGSIFDEADEEVARTAAELQSNQEAAESRRHAESEERASRTLQIDQSLERAHSLAGENKFSEAQQVINEVLFLDEGNVEARRLREQIGEKQVPKDLLDIVQQTVNPDVWASSGGILADAEFGNGVFMFRTLEDSPEAQQTVSKARAFLAFLQNAVPGAADAGAIDVPPEEPAAPDLAPDLRLIVYDVRDLIKAVQAVEANASDDDAAARIAEIITEFIDPAHWQENGGEHGRIQILKGNLIIITTPANHQAIGELIGNIAGAIAPRGDGANADAGAPVALDAPDAAAKPQAIASDADQIEVHVYDVRELLMKEPKGGKVFTRPQLVGQIVSILQENVDPDGWREFGGDRGAMREIAGALVVINSRENQRDISGLLDQLLILHREEPWQRQLRDARAPIRFENNSLEQIFAFFEQVTGLDFAVDWEALATIGVKPEDTVTLQLTETTMTTALERVLQSVGKDDQHPVFTGKDATLLITSPEALPKDEQASAVAIEAVAKAEAAMRERMLKAMRHEARLRRVIDQRLWAAVVAAKQEETGPIDSASALTPALSQGERENAVVILVHAVDDATLDSLKSHGLRIDDSNARMKLVAGAIEAAKLAALASLDFVRRIEPIVIAP